ncbi:ornithine carbamoyltransferase [Rhodococcus qingshengii]|uniref:ornithine carbamoyltransferase n=1 Tax=Rhodococcus qingshengii TaxID=334542 RepID=UPI0036DA9301
MAARHVISLNDLSDYDIHGIVHRGAELAALPRTRLPGPGLLDGLVLGVWFNRTSTRTRTAFTTAALRLHAQVVTFGPNDLQTNTGETLDDTARVLGRMLDGLVVRTAGPEAEMRALGRYNTVLVNAMSAEEHPTQALADLSTLAARFGTVDGLRVLYVGEGNNTAVALARGLSRYSGTLLDLRTPPGYGLPKDVLDEAADTARRHGSRVIESHDLDHLPSEVEVVYTTRWQTTGTSKADPGWRKDFERFRVDGELFARFPNARFMHDLPAHRGEEVTGEVLDGAKSIAFDQAEMKMHSATAIWEWCYQS